MVRLLRMYCVLCRRAYASVRVAERARARMRASARAGVHACVRACIARVHACAHVCMHVRMHVRMCGWAGERVRVRMHVGFSVARLVECVRLNGAISGPNLKS